MSGGATFKLKKNGLKEEVEASVEWTDIQYIATWVGVSNFWVFSYISNHIFECI